MLAQAITDWNDAYDNTGHIVNGDKYPEQWQQRSHTFRQSVAGDLDVAYGSHSRERYDLFSPDIAAFTRPSGLFVYIHGGYWQKTDKSFWSFLAQGPLQLGWSVAIPSYVLCPETSIAGIQKMLVKAVVQASQRIDGPIVLAGHSAGGHLVQSMMCNEGGLPANVLMRVAHTLSISGVADLRPLLQTRLNDALQLDENSARECSPIFKQPNLSVPLTAWVGAGERAEFIRQNALIGNIWRGLGATTQVVEEPDKNHFTVIDGLCDPQSSMLRSILPDIGSL